MRFYYVQFSMRNIYQYVKCPPPIHMKKNAYMILKQPFALQFFLFFYTPTFYQNPIGVMFIASASWLCQVAMMVSFRWFPYQNFRYWVEFHLAVHLALPQPSVKLKSTMVELCSTLPFWCCLAISSTLVEMLESLLKYN